jgi:hypothetical protein
MTPILKDVFNSKAFLASSTTASWDVHERLLRPTLYDAQSLGFEISPKGVGIEGGVILIHIDDRNPDCSVMALAARAALER